MTATRLPTYFISHGGGPWPWMKEQMGGAYDRLEASLARMPADIGATPRAVLMLSAHWEAPRFTVQTHANPPMLYDYSGFPDFTYHIRYPAPGAPDVASRVRALLAAAGIAVGRGRRARLRPRHVRADGRDLAAGRRADAAAVAASKGLDAGRAPRARARARAAARRGHPDRGQRPELSQPARVRPRGARAVGRVRRAGWSATLATRMRPRARHALAAWERAPAARLAHPREEHLLPLMVALGAAEGEAATRVYHEPTSSAASRCRATALGDAAGRSSGALPLVALGASLVSQNLGAADRQEPVPRRRRRRA